jgi:hypothetical protein
MRAESSIPHGTVSRYSNLDCRCDACRAAASEYNRLRYKVRRDDVIARATIWNRQHPEARRRTCGEYRQRYASERAAILEPINANSFCSCGAPVEVWHHVEPTTKLFGIGDSNRKRSLVEVWDELMKCVPMCRACHARLHNQKRDRDVSGRLA